jgi:hypothetical protein
MLAERGIRSRIVYRTDQDDRALALVGAGMGVALMPAIFDALNVKKVPVRDFDAKCVISSHWNEDAADDRLDRVVAFATTHNWASSDQQSAARSPRPDAVKSSMRKSTGSAVGGQKPRQASGR